MAERKRKGDKAKIKTQGKYDRRHSDYIIYWYSFGWIFSNFYILNIFWQKWNMKKENLGLFLMKKTTHFLQNTFFFCLSFT